MNESLKKKLLIQHEDFSLSTRAKPRCPPFEAASQTVCRPWCGLRHRRRRSKSLAGALRGDAERWDRPRRRSLGLQAQVGWGTELGTTSETKVAPRNGRQKPRCSACPRCTPSAPLSAAPAPPSLPVTPLSQDSHLTPCEPRAEKKGQQIRLQTQHVTVTATEPRCKPSPPRWAPWAAQWQGVTEKRPTPCAMPEEWQKGQELSCLSPPLKPRKGVFSWKRQTAASWGVTVGVPMC